MSRKTIEDDILSNLNKFFGYKSLRPGQLTIITKILGKNDALICKESGYGKSLCFQLAGLMQNGVTIIISPLKSSAEEECRKLAGFTKVIFLFLHNFFYLFDRLLKQYVWICRSDAHIYIQTIIKIKNKI